MAFWRTILSLLIIITQLSLISALSRIPISIGLIGAFTGDEAGDNAATLAGATLAMWVINNAGELLPNHTLVPMIKDDDSTDGANFFGTLELAGVNARGSSFPAQRVPFVIGPLYSSRARLSAEVATVFQLPLLSPTASATTLGGSAEPYFTRTFPGDDNQAIVLVNLILKMGWQRVGTIFASDTYSASLANAFQLACQAARISVAVVQTYDVPTVDVSKQVTQLKLSGVLVFFVVGHTPDATIVLEELRVQGMTGPPYVYLFPDGVGASIPNAPQGSLQTHPAASMDSPEYLAFQVNWNRAYSIDPNIVWNYTTPGNGGTVFAYDAAVLVAMTLREFMDEVHSNCTQEVQYFRAQSMASIGNFINDGNNDTNDSGATNASTPSTSHNTTRFPDRRSDNTSNITQNFNRSRVPRSNSGKTPTTMTNSDTENLGNTTEEEQNQLIERRCLARLANSAGAMLVAILRKQTLQGVTGNITFDGSNRLNPLYGVYNILESGWVQVAWATPSVMVFEDIAISDNVSTGITTPLSSATTTPSAKSFPAIIWADGTTNIPKDRLPLPPILLSIEASLAFFVLCAFAFAFLFFLAGVVVVNWRIRAIFNASPPFLLLLLLGGIIFNTGAVLQILPPTPSLCIANFWCMIIGFTCVSGSLSLKLYRLHKIFNAQHLKVVALNDVDLFRLLAVMLTVDVGLLLAWTLVTPPILDERARCTTEFPAVEYTIMGVKLLSVLVAACLLYLTRNIPGKFNESFPVAFSIYSVVVSAILWGSVYYLIDSPAAIALQIASILFCVISVSAAMLAPKIRAIVILKRPKTSSNKTSHVSNGGSGGSGGSGFQHTQVPNNNQVDIPLSRADLEAIYHQTGKMVKSHERKRDGIIEEMGKWVEQKWLLEEEIRYLRAQQVITRKKSRRSQTKQIEQSKKAQEQQNLTAPRDDKTNEDNNNNSSPETAATQQKQSTNITTKNKSRDSSSMFKWRESGRPSSINNNNDLMRWRESGQPSSHAGKEAYQRGSATKPGSASALAAILRRSQEKEKERKIEQEKEKLKTNETEQGEQEGEEKEPVVRIRIRNDIAEEGTNSNNEKDSCGRENVEDAVNTRALPPTENQGQGDEGSGCVDEDRNKRVESSGSARLGSSSLGATFDGAPDEAPYSASTRAQRALTPRASRPPLLSVYQSPSAMTSSASCASRGNVMTDAPNATTSDGGQRQSPILNKKSNRTSLISSRAFSLKNRERDQEWDLDEESEGTSPMEDEPISRLRSSNLLMSAETAAWLKQRHQISKKSSLGSSSPRLTPRSSPSPGVGGAHAGRFTQRGKSNPSEKELRELSKIAASALPSLHIEEGDVGAIRKLPNDRVAMKDSAQQFDRTDQQQQLRGSQRHNSQSQDAIILLTDQECAEPTTTPSVQIHTGDSRPSSNHIPESVSTALPSDQVRIQSQAPKEQDLLVRNNKTEGKRRWSSRSGRNGPTGTRLSMDTIITSLTRAISGPTAPQSNSDFVERERGVEDVQAAIPGVQSHSQQQDNVVSNREPESSSIQMQPLAPSLGNTGGHSKYTQLPSPRGESESTRTSPSYPGSGVEVPPTSQGHQLTDRTLVENQMSSLSGTRQSGVDINSTTNVSDDTNSIQKSSIENGDLGDAVNASANEGTSGGEKSSGGGDPRYARNRVNRPTSTPLQYSTVTSASSSPSSQITLSPVQGGERGTLRLISEKTAGIKAHAQSGSGENSGEKERRGGSESDNKGGSVNDDQGGSVNDDDDQGGSDNDDNGDDQRRSDDQGDQSRSADDQGGSG